MLLPPTANLLKPPLRSIQFLNLLPLPLPKPRPFQNPPQHLILPLRILIHMPPFLLPQLPFLLPVDPPQLVIRPTHVPHSQVIPQRLTALHTDIEIPLRFSLPITAPHPKDVPAGNAHLATMLVAAFGALEGDCDGGDLGRERDDVDVDDGFGGQPGDGGRANVFDRDVRDVFEGGFEGLFDLEELCGPERVVFGDCEFHGERSVEVEGK
jgi:hypothetical protein